MRVLVTGSAGRVGQTVVRGLQPRHTIRGFDRIPTPDLDDALVGDLGDLDLLVQAAKDMDAAIHLGGNGGERPWPEINNNNYQGTYNLLEACRQNKVKRVAFASRAGLLGAYPQSITRTMDMQPRPRSTYDVSKIFGESMGYMFAHRYEMEFVSVRIGNFNHQRDQPEHPHHLSHGDCVRVFEQAITHPGIRYEVVFGVSDSNWPLYDLDHGRRAIGYEPQDFADVPEDQRQG